MLDIIPAIIVKNSFFDAYPHHTFGLKNPHIVKTLNSRTSSCERLIAVTERESGEGEPRSSLAGGAMQE